MSNFEFGFTQSRPASYDKVDVVARSFAEGYDDDPEGTIESAIERLRSMDVQVPIEEIINRIELAVDFYKDADAGSISTYEDY